MSIYFPRPSSFPRLPNPIISDSRLSDVSEITPDFLFSLPRESGGVEFSSRKKLHLFVTNASEVSDVLVRNAEDFLKGDQEIALSQAIGWGLIGLEGAHHKQAQKAAGPALRVEALNSYVSNIKEVAHKHLSDLENKSAVPMRRALRCLSQEAAERSLFSRGDLECDFSYQDHIFAINVVVFSPDLRASSPKSAMQLTRDYAASRQSVMDHVSKLILAWKDNPGKGTFLIDYLSGGHEIDDGNFDEFHQQISVFLSAATETTAALASWTILLLSENPDWWYLLKKEAEEAGPVQSYEDVRSLRVLDAVINESLRLYPPAWLIPRIARVDTSVGNRRVKAGTRIIVSPYVSHRMPEYFEDPDAFNPDRWMTQSDSAPRGAFFPFGLGNRICIGERYGKLTAKIVILAALERGSFFMSNNAQVNIDNHSLLLNPSSGVMFNLARES